MAETSDIYNFIPVPPNSVAPELAAPLETVNTGLNEILSYATSLISTRTLRLIEEGLEGGLVAELELASQLQPRAERTIFCRIPVGDHDDGHFIVNEQTPDQPTHIYYRPDAPGGVRAMLDALGQAPSLSHGLRTLATMAAKPLTQPEPLSPFTLHSDRQFGPVWDVLTTELNLANIPLQQYAEYSGAARKKPVMPGLTVRITNEGGLDAETVIGVEDDFLFFWKVDEGVLNRGEFHDLRAIQLLGQSVMEGIPPEDRHFIILPDNPDAPTDDFVVIRNTDIEEPERGIASVAYNANSYQAALEIANRFNSREYGRQFFTSELTAERLQRVVAALDFVLAAERGILWGDEEA